MSLNDKQRQALSEIDAELEANPRPYISRATQYNPDQQAEVIRLSETRKLPLDTVENNLGELQRRELAESIDVSDYPKLSEFLTDDKNARLAVDDVDNLKGLERALTPQMKAWEPSLWQRIKMLGGFSDRKRARASNERVARQIAEEEGISVNQVYRSVGGERPFNPEARPPIQSIIEGTAIVGKQLPYVPQATVNSVLKTIRGGDIDTEESILDSWINATEPPAPKDYDPSYESLYGIGESLGYSLSTLTSGVIGSAVGSPGGPITSGATAFAFSSAAAYRASKDEFMSRVKERLDNRSQKLFGLPLIKEEWDKAYQEFEGAAIKYGAWEAIPEALSNLIFMRALSAPIKGMSRAALEDITKRAANVMISEQLTETVTGYGQSQAEAEAGIGEAKTLPQAFRDQFLSTSIVTGLLGGLGAGAKSVYDTGTEAISKRLDKKIEQIVQTMSEQERIDQVVTYAQSSKLRGRMKDRFQRFLQTVSNQEVHIAPDSIREAVEKGEQVPDYAVNQLSELNTDVVISVDQFAADFAANETLLETIRPHVRMSPTTLSLDDVQKDDESVKTLLEQANQAQELKTQADEIYEQVKDQIVATGRQSEATARYSAALIPAYVTVKAEQTGLSVKEVYEQMGLKIIGPAQPVEQTGPQVVYREGKPYIQDVALADVEVTVKAIEEETGRTVTMKERADVAIQEVDSNMDRIRKLIECLGG